MRFIAQFLVAGAFIGVSVLSIAADNADTRAATGRHDAELLEQLCTHVSAYADSVMRVRQDGVPLEIALKRQRRVSGDGGIGEVLQEILTDTYATPQAVGHAERTTKISEFSNKWYMTCKQQDRFVGLSRSPSGKQGK